MSLMYTEMSQWPQYITENRYRYLEALIYSYKPANVVYMHVTKSAGSVWIIKKYI